MSFARIIQNYVLREEAGTLASDVMDTNKVSAVVAQYVASSVCIFTVYNQSMFVVFYWQGKMQVYDYN